MKRPKRIIKRTLIAALITLAITTSPVIGLNFNWILGDGISENDVNHQTFIDAGEIYSSLYEDNITVNISIDFESLNPGVLGSANTIREIVDYGDYITALTADASTEIDMTAIQTLSTDDGVDLFLNRTKNNPNGSGSATPYIDAFGSGNPDNNNLVLRLAAANAKSVGLVTESEVDVYISHSNQFNWDYNRDDGIIGYDAVGVAIHEIGHGLGFLSGVDILDYNSTETEDTQFKIEIKQSQYHNHAYCALPHSILSNSLVPESLFSDIVFEYSSNSFNEELFTYISALDLFRYSSDSYQAGINDTNIGVGVIDWTADTRHKYLSLDNGATNLYLTEEMPRLSTGKKHGDGWQNSHWLYGSEEIMDPTSTKNQLENLSYWDEISFDIIGYNLVSSSSSSSVPEPSTFMAFCISGLLGRMLIKRKKK